MIVFTSAGDISFIENEFVVVELDEFNKVLDTKFIRRPMMDTRSIDTCPELRYKSIFSMIKS